MVNEFEINKQHMDEPQLDSESQFADLRVPLGGSEDEAIRSVTEQLTSMGVTPNEAPVQKIVRQARDST